MTRTFAILAAAALATVGLAARANDPPGITRAGDFTFRYNAVASNALPADAAADLGLAHSARQGIVNVLVQRGSGYAAPSVDADVSGHATTAAGAPVPIRFRTIRDRNGVSYLGTFAVPATGILRFDVDVTPRGGATTHLHFTQSFLVP